MLVPQKESKNRNKGLLTKTGRKYKQKGIARLISKEQYRGRGRTTGETPKQAGTKQADRIQGSVN